MVAGFFYYLTDKHNNMFQNFLIIPEPTVKLSK
jgi:hypothetical protein